MPRKFIESMGYAWKGIIYALRTQRNMIVHSFTGMLAVLLAIALRVSLPEIALIVMVISMVIVLELLNTAVEEIVNMLHITRKMRAMITKDVSAAAVLVAAISALIVGCIIFIPRIMPLIWR